MLSKKANVEITIFVVLALAVVGVAMFIFLTNSGKIVDVIENPKVVENVYVEEDLLKFQVYVSGEGALVKTYEEFIDGTGNNGLNDYIEGRRTDGFGNIYFGEVNKNLDERFLKRFEENFNVEIARYDLNREFVFLGSGDDFSVEAKDVEFTTETDKMKVSYKPKTKVDFSLEKLGLHSFKEIENAKDNRDFSVLQNFDFEIKTGDLGIPQTGSVAVLTSKKVFFNGASSRKIVIEFVPT